MGSKTGILKEKEAEKLERIAFILKTVAHPLRLGVIHLLEQYPRLSVSEICEKLGSEHFYGSKGVPQLPTFGHECSRNPLGFIPVDEILFVENLSYIYCSGNATPNLEGDIRTRKKLFSHTFFRQLPAGGTYNAASHLTENKVD